MFVKSQPKNGQTSSDLLQMIKDGGDVDETWIYHDTPETKQGESVLKKTKAVPSALRNDSRDEDLLQIMNSKLKQTVVLKIWKKVTEIMYILCLFELP